ncbi:MAG TPA: class I SAM-dependent methyltransferase [Candidatus Brocadiia bacterium]|nr:class I SAM-dependent methyltransferase [Candidatus Brocadiia bacterium]
MARSPAPSGKGEPGNAGCRLGDFTSQADAYARSRPDYPERLIDILIECVGVKSGDKVVDIGAGTGIFTRQLAARGFTVTAIEPGEAMRSKAPPMSGVVWQDGTFEETGMPSESQAWATAAQAFHWADPARALPEIRRILKPGGYFSILWNNRTEDPAGVLKWTREAIERLIGRFDDEHHDNRDWPAILRSTGDLTDVRFHDAPHAAAIPAERYMDIWRSHNRLNVVAGPERFGRFMAELGKYLRGRGIKTVTVPYITRAWTARRR